MKEYRKVTYYELETGHRFAAKNEDGLITLVSLPGKSEIMTVKSDKSNDIIVWLKEMEKKLSESKRKREEKEKK